MQAGHYHVAGNNGERREFPSIPAIFKIATTLNRRLSMGTPVVSRSIRTLTLV